MNPFHPKQPNPTLRGLLRLCPQVGRRLENLMAEIDKLLNNMARKGIQYVILANGQPTRAFKDGQEAQGAAFDLLKLMNMAREVVPPADRVRLADKYDATFPYRTTDGFFTLRVQRKKQDFGIEAWLGAVSSALALAPQNAWQPQLLPSPKSLLHEVRDVALSSDGTWLASAAGDFIKLWHSETGKHSSNLCSPQERNEAGAITVVPGASKILPGRQGLHKPININTTRGRYDAWSVEFSPNDQTVVGGIFGGYWMFPTEGTKSFRGLPAHVPLAFAWLPDGSYLVMATGGNNGLSEKAKQTMETISIASKVASVAFGTPDIDGPPDDPNGLLQLMRAPSGKFQVWNWNDKPREASSDGVVTSVAVSPDGQFLLSGDNWHNVRVFDLANLPSSDTPFVSMKFSTLEKAKKHQSRHCVSLSGEVHSVSCPALGSQALACSKEQLAVFDVATASVLWRKRSLFQKAVFSRHGDKIFAASQSNVLVLSPQDGQQLEAPLSLPATVTSLATSRDGRTLACGCGDGSLHVWRLW